MSRIFAYLFAALVLSSCNKLAEPPHQVAPGQLSQADKARISELTIRVGGDANYPPFVFKGEDGKLTGLAVDYLDAVAKNIGLKYEIAFVGQRADMLKKLQNKEIDVTYASRSSSSRPYLMVTQPYEYSKGTLLVLNTTNPGRIKTVGAGRGYASVTWLKTNKPEYEVIEYDDDEQCIKFLRAGTVDSCIMGREMVFFYFDKLKLDKDDFFMAPVEYNYFLSFGVHVDNIELVDILMKGMETLPASKRRELLTKWLKEPYL